MKGTVRSFVAEKKFGFIDGSDGQSYFVHINDARGSNYLYQGQDVEFDPMPTKKGLSAKKVVPGPEPEAIFVNPTKFIMTKADHVKGCETIAIVGENIWGESNDPNQARELLKDVALRSGANAVVCMNLSKYPTSDACSNYKYTMHRYYGHAVVVKRVEYTTDPIRIAQSNKEIAQYQSVQYESSYGESAFVKAPSYMFYPLLAYFWLRTFAKIIIIGSVFLIARGAGVKRSSVDSFLKKLTRCSSNDAHSRAA